VAGAGCVGVDPPCYDEEAIVSVPADQPLNKNKEEALTRRLGKTLGWRSWNFFFFFFLRYKEFF
jgi:hypothetical protein